MKIIDRNMVFDCFSMKQAIAADEKAFCLLSEEKVIVPQRTVLTAGKTDFLFMPSYCPELDVVCMKNINLNPENASIQKATSFSKLLLMDAKTGEHLALIDGDAVTALRTGAVAGLAFSRLMSHNKIEKAAVFGTGIQAEMQLEAMFAVAEPKYVSICARNMEKAEAFAEKMEKRHPAKYEVTSQGDDAVRSAGLIMTATSSLKPLFSADAVMAGATICSVGNYSPSGTELPIELPGRISRVYVDSTAAAKTEAGELILAEKEGYWSFEKLTGELGQLCLGLIPGRESEEEIILVKSVGVGVQDLVAAKEIYEAEEARG